MSRNLIAGLIPSFFLTQSFQTANIPDLFTQLENSTAKINYQPTNLTIMMTLTVDNSDSGDFDNNHNGYTSLMIYSVLLLLLIVTFHQKVELEISASKILNMIVKRNLPESYAFWCILILVFQFSFYRLCGIKHHFFSINLWTTMAGIFLAYLSSNVIIHEHTLTLSNMPTAVYIGYILSVSALGLIVYFNALCIFLRMDHLSKIIKSNSNHLTRFQRFVKHLYITVREGPPTIFLTLCLIFIFDKL